MPRSKIDFASARDLVEATYRCEEQARDELYQFADQPGPDDAGLNDWIDQARKARRVYRERCLEPLRVAEERLRAEAAAVLRAEGLEVFAAALETGDYTVLEF